MSAVGGGGRTFPVYIDLITRGAEQAVGMLNRAAAAVGTLQSSGAKASGVVDKTATSMATLGTNSNTAATAMAASGQGAAALSRSAHAAQVGVKGIGDAATLTSRGLQSGATQTQSFVAGLRGVGSEGASVSRVLDNTTRSGARLSQGVSRGAAAWETFKSSGTGARFAMIGLVGSINEAVFMTERVMDSQAKQADAQERLNKLADAGQQGTKDYVQAQRDLDDATRSLNFTQRIMIQSWLDNVAFLGMLASAVPKLISDYRTLRSTSAAVAAGHDALAASSGRVAASNVAVTASTLPLVRSAAQVTTGATAQAVAKTALTSINDRLAISNATVTAGHAPFIASSTGVVEATTARTTANVGLIASNTRVVSSNAAVSASNAGVVTSSVAARNATAGIATGLVAATAGMGGYTGALRNAAPATAGLATASTGLGSKLKDVLLGLVGVGGGLGVFAGRAKDAGKSVAQLENSAAKGGGALSTLNNNAGIASIGLLGIAKAAGVVGGAILAAGAIIVVFKDQLTDLSEKLLDFVGASDDLRQQQEGVRGAMDDFFNTIFAGVPGLDQFVKKNREMGDASKKTTGEIELSQEAIDAHNKSISELSPEIQKVAQAWGVYEASTYSASQRGIQLMEGLDAAQGMMNDARTATIELATANGVTLHDAYAMTTDELVNWLVNMDEIAPTSEEAAEASEAAAEKMAEAWQTSFDRISEAQDAWAGTMKSASETIWKEMGGEMKVGLNDIKQEVQGGFGFNEDFWETVFPQQIASNAFEKSFDIEELIDDMEDTIDRAVDKEFITEEQAEQWFDPLMSYMEHELPRDSEEAIGFLVGQMPGLIAEMKPALVNGVVEVGRDMKGAVDTNIVQPIVAGLQGLDEGASGLTFGDDILGIVEASLPGLRAMGTEGEALAGVFRGILEATTPMYDTTQEKVAAVIDILGQMGMGFDELIMGVNEDGDEFADVMDNKISGPAKDAAIGTLTAWQILYDLWGDTSMADKLGQKIAELSGQVVEDTAAMSAAAAGTHKTWTEAFTQTGLGAQDLEEVMLRLRTDGFEVLATSADGMKVALVDSATKSKQVVIDFANGSITELDATSTSMGDVETASGTMQAGISGDATASVTSLGQLKTAVEGISSAFGNLKKSASGAVGMGTFLYGQTDYLEDAKPEDVAPAAPTMPVMDTTAAENKWNQFQQFVTTKTSEIGEHIKTWAEQQGINLAAWDFSGVTAKFGEFWTWAATGLQDFGVNAKQWIDAQTAFLASSWDFTGVTTAFGEFWTWAASGLTNFGVNAAAWIRSNVGVFTNPGNWDFSGVSAVFGGFWTWAATGLVDFGVNAATWIRSQVGVFTNPGNWDFSGVATVISGLGTTITDALGGVYNFVTTSGPWGQIKALGDQIATFFKPLTDAFAALFGGGLFQEAQAAGGENGGFVIDFETVKQQYDDFLLHVQGVMTQVTLAWVGHGQAVTLAMTTNLAPAFTQYGTWLTGALTNVSLYMQQMSAQWLTHFTNVQAYTTTNLGAALTMYGTFLTGAINNVAIGTGLMTASWLMHAQAVGAVFNTTLATALSNYGTFLQGAANNVLTYTTQMSAHWLTHATSVGASINGPLSSALSTYGSLLSGAANNVNQNTNAMTNSWNTHANAVADAVNSLADSMNSLADSGEEAVSRLAAAVGQAMGSIVGDMGEAEQAARDLQSAIDALQSKTITIRTNYTTSGAAPNAEGTNRIVRGPELLLVGEAGAEHVKITPLSGAATTHNGIAPQMTGNIMAAAKGMDAIVRPLDNKAVAEFVGQRGHRVREIKEDTEDEKTVVRVERVYKQVPKMTKGEWKDWADTVGWRVHDFDKKDYGFEVDLKPKKNSRVLAEDFDMPEDFTGGVGDEGAFRGGGRGEGDFGGPARAGQAASAFQRPGARGTAATGSGGSGGTVTIGGAGGGGGGSGITKVNFAGPVTVYTSVNLSLEIDRQKFGRLTREVVAEGYAQTK